jgi:hypothetical protein
VQGRKLLQDLASDAGFRHQIKPPMTMTWLETWSHANCKDESLSWARVAQQTPRTCGARRAVEKTFNIFFNHFAKLYDRLKIY